MSETCPVLTTAQVDTDKLGGDPDDELQIRVRTGRLIPLVDLRVVDENMRDVPHDGKTTGEVVVRAPWLTQSYFKNPEASEQLWADGYLHTNDIGTIGADGYLQITDRLKDVIKTGGEWVSSLQLEDILSQHPAVGEAAVVGVKDDKWGERPLALIVPKPGQGAQLNVAALQAHVRSYADRGVVSKYAVPERIVFVETLDKTSVGKLDKKRMREKYASQEHPAVSVGSAA